MKPKWQGDPIVFSGNTDCYQPLEASYRLTRQCFWKFAEIIGILNVNFEIRFFLPLV